MLMALLVLLRSDRIDLPRTPGGRARESGASSAAGHVNAYDQAPTTPYEGPTLLDSPRQRVAGVAHRRDHRAARHRGAVAPPVAPSSVDVALDTDTSGAARPRMRP
jgi:hypothetical protein